MRVRHKGNIRLCGNFQAAGAERPPFSRSPPEAHVGKKASLLRTPRLSGLSGGSCACETPPEAYVGKTKTSHRTFDTTDQESLWRTALIVAQQFTALSLQSPNGGTWRKGCVTGLQGSSKNGLMHIASKCQVPTTALTQARSTFVIDVL